MTVASPRVVIAPGQRRSPRPWEISRVEAPLSRLALMTEEALPDSSESASWSKLDVTDYPTYEPRT